MVCPKSHSQKLNPNYSSYFIEPIWFQKIASEVAYDFLPNICIPRTKFPKGLTINFVHCSNLEEDRYKGKQSTLRMIFGEGPEVSEDKTVMKFPHCPPGLTECFLSDLCGKS